MGDPSRKTAILLGMGRKIYMGTAENAAMGTVTRAPINSEAWILVGFHRISSEIMVLYVQSADFL